MTFKYTNYTISPELDAVDIYEKADFVLGKTRPEYREWLEAFKPKIYIDTDQESIHRGIFLVISPDIFDAPRSTQIRIVEDLLVEYLDAQLGFTQSETVRTAALEDSDQSKAMMTIALTNLWGGIGKKIPVNGSYFNDKMAAHLLPDVLAAQRMLWEADLYADKRLEQFLDRYAEESIDAYRKQNLFLELLPLSMGFEPLPYNRIMLVPDDLKQEIRDHFDTITENPDNKSPQELLERSFPHFHSCAEHFLGAVKNVAELKQAYPDYQKAIQSDDTERLKAMLRAGTTSDAIEFMLHSADRAAANILRATHDLHKQGIASEIAVIDSIINGKTLQMHMAIAVEAENYGLAKLYKKAIEAQRKK